MAGIVTVLPCKKITAMADSNGTRITDVVFGAREHNYPTKQIQSE